MAKGRQRLACSEAGRLTARKCGRLQGVVRLIAAAEDCGAQPGCAQGCRVACCDGDGRVSILAQRWQSCAWRGQLVAAAVGCRDYWRLPRHSKHGPCMSRIFRIIVSVKVVVVCIVIRLPWQRVFASEGVLLSESSVVTCESRPLYLSLSLRAWDCVACSARRGLPPWAENRI